MYTTYDCPACGKADGSHDGYTFCGKCEQEYREREADQAKEDEKWNRFEAWWKHRMEEEGFALDTPPKEYARAAWDGALKT